MEIRPNFGEGSHGFFGGGVSFFVRGGVPDFPKQGRTYPSVTPLAQLCLPPIFRKHITNILRNCNLCYGFRGAFTFECNLILPRHVLRVVKHNPRSGACNSHFN